MHEAVKSEPIPKQVWLMMAAVILGAMLTQFDSTVVNLSLSTIQSELHASIETAQWIISGYLLALALALPLTAWVVDEIGAKRLFLWCFSAFTFASIMCGFSRSIESIIAWRVVQGIAGGFLSPMTQMMVVKIAGNNLARVMSLAATPILIAPLFGPVLAGAILKYSSWPWLFFINLPIGIVAIVLTMLYVPDDRVEGKKQTFDWVGSLLLSPGLTVFLFGLQDIYSTKGKLLLLVGTLLLTTFIVYSNKRSEVALLDPRLFQKHKSFARSVSLLFLHMAGAYSGQMIIPLYLTAGCKMTPTEAGNLIAVSAIGMLCSYPLVGRLVEQFGPRRVALTGAVLSVIGTAQFLWLASTKFDFMSIAVALFFRGIGQSCIGIPCISTGYSEIAPDKLSKATTGANIVQRLGGPIGTTIMAMCLPFGSGVSSNMDEHSFSVAFSMLLLLQFLIVCSASLLPSTERQVRQVRQ